MGGFTLMPAGSAIVCFGCLLAGIHQKKFGPARAHWLSYLALLVVGAGGVVFVTGAMMTG